MAVESPEAVVSNELSLTDAQVGDRSLLIAVEISVHNNALGR